MIGTWVFTELFSQPFYVSLKFFKIKSWGWNSFPVIMLMLLQYKDLIAHDCCQKRQEGRGGRRPRDMMVRGTEDRRGNFWKPEGHQEKLGGWKEEVCFEAGREPTRLEWELGRGRGSRGNTSSYIPRFQLSRRGRGTVISQHPFSPPSLGTLTFNLAHRCPE